eukprot:gb/GECG01002902.1/.p1 GENE.gb/GECG01002902.1/~~gb/GECG01002902.1/.p1  ORF type:complete len:378 (+),score=10.51 gb/GECG01002902.1/:1-1134(+)
MFCLRYCTRTSCTSRIILATFFQRPGCLRRSVNVHTRVSFSTKQRWQQRGDTNNRSNKEYLGAGSPTAQYARRLCQNAKDTLRGIWRQTRLLQHVRSSVPQSREHLLRTLKEKVYRCDDILRLSLARAARVATDKQWWKTNLARLRKENVVAFYRKTPFEMVYHILMLQTFVWFVWWYSHRIFHASKGERTGLVGLIGKNFALSLHGLRDGRLWTACTSSLLNIDLLSLVGNGAFMLMFGLSCINAAGPWHFLSLFFISTTLSNLSYSFLGSLAYLKAQLAASKSKDQLYDHGVCGPEAAINALIGFTLSGNPTARCSVPQVGSIRLALPAVAYVVVCLLGMARGGGNCVEYGCDAVAGIGTGIVYFLLFRKGKILS